MLRVILDTCRLRRSRLKSVRLWVAGAGYSQYQLITVNSTIYLIASTLIRHI